MLSLSEMKPIKKISAFFVPMSCCKNKQSLCIDCYTQVAQCPCCRANLETNSKHVFNTMIRILVDYDLEKVSGQNSLFTMLMRFTIDAANAKRTGSTPTTPQGRKLSEYEDQITHMMTTCADLTRYFTSKLGGLENPFSYTLSEKEHSLLKTTAQKGVNYRLEKKRAEEARRESAMRDAIGDAMENSMGDAIGGPMGEVIQHVLGVIRNHVGTTGTVRVFSSQSGFSELINQQTPHVMIEDALLNQNLRSERTEAPAEELHNDSSVPAVPTQLEPASPSTNRGWQISDCCLQ
jgi:hypothetical protein